MISRVRLSDREPYGPHGHHGVLNRALVGAREQGIREVSIWHGAFDPGGESELHVHPDSVQVYYVLAGTFVAGDASTEWTLMAEDTLVVPAGQQHFIANRSGGPGKVLVITAPGIR